MKRKFAIDLPRLRIGSSKGETKGSKGEPPFGLDSPPVTPKSVRPPLSPRIDYDLRTACALIIQEYQPPIRTDEDQHDTDQDTPLWLEQEWIDPIQESPGNEVELPEQSINVDSTAVIERPAISREASEEIVIGMFEHEFNLENQHSLGAQEKDQQWTQPGAAVWGAEQTTSSEPVEAKSTRIVKSLHKRSFSQPLRLSNATPRTEVLERPRTAPRSDSTMTNGSTPQTDGSHYGWSGSTAPTTAAITPARTSNRASHMLQSDSSSSSVPKIVPADGEWMKGELEKHMQAQEEARAQQELEDQVLSSLPRGTAHGVTAANALHSSAPVVKIPARKPVPGRSTDSKRSTSGPQRSTSRHSGELRRSESRKRTPRSESRHEMELLRPESRDPKENSMHQPQTQQASNGFQDDSQPKHMPPAPRPSVNVSRAQSRSRSITRQIREFIRPSSRNQSRGGSVDISRPESRSRSIDSFRSSVSALAPSFDTATNRVRNWKPFHRNQDSMTSADVSRPGSSDSRIRGRGFGRGAQQSPPEGTSKPPINLNRELPPLPSLDQWKPLELEKEVEAEAESARPKHIASMVKRQGTNGSEMQESIQVRSPTRSQPPKLSIDTTTSSQPPRDSVLNDVALGMHPKRKSSLGAPYDPSRYPIPNDPSSFSPISPESQAAFSERMGDPSRGGLISEEPANSGKGHAVNYSHGSVGRKVSQHGRIAAGSMPREHNRATSEQQLNFSRKISSEDYNRTYDMRYQNVVEIKSPDTLDRNPLPTTPKNKSKKKWWKLGSKQKKEMTWMDHVARSGSGSHSGTILIDEVSGSPVARY